MAASDSVALRLRRATAADALLLAAMHTASRASAYRGLLPDAWIDRTMAGESRAHWLEKMPRIDAGAGAAWIAEERDEAVAFACVLAPDEHGSVYVDNLHALPACKGRGAGSALLDVVRRWAIEGGATGLHLLVLEANVAAIGFYERHGWRRTERLDDTMGGVVVPVLRYRLVL